MKAYTDIEQSKKLVEILPLESADMYWMHVEREGFNDFWKVETIQGVFRPYSMNIRCWSLSALLDVFRKSDDNVEIWSNHEDWFVSVAICETTSRDLLDACVAMVQILHEKKIINFNNKEELL